MENNQMCTTAQSNATILPEMLKYRETLRIRKRPYLHTDESEMPVTKKMMVQDEKLHKLKRSITDKLVAKTLPNLPEYRTEETEMRNAEIGRQEYFKTMSRQLKKLHKAAGSRKIRLESVQATRV